MTNFISELSVFNCTCMQYNTERSLNGMKLTVGLVTETDNTCKRLANLLYKDKTDCHFLKVSNTLLVL